MSKKIYRIVLLGWDGKERLTQAQLVLNEHASVGCQLSVNNCDYRVHGFRYGKTPQILLQPLSPRGFGID